MHVVKNTKPIVMGRTLGTLEPGEWFVADQNAFELGMKGERGDVRASHFETGFRFKDGESVVFVRSGAIGDLFFLSPVLREIRAQNPNSRIGLSCFPHHHEFAKDFPVDEVLSYPLSIDAQNTYERIISLENLMELNPGVHATDTFALAMGVEVKDYKPVYFLGEGELSDAKTKYPNQGRPRVGLQMKASRVTRDYPLSLWGRVIHGLLLKNWDVFLFGAPGQLPAAQKSTPHVFNLSADALSFRESAAVLKTMDVFCGVDSALLPLCHALDVPAVGIYGPFAWETRTGKAPLTRAISGNGDCAPCYWHTHDGKHFPPNCPTAQHGFCGVLADIPPERIIAQIDKKRP